MVKETDTTGNLSRKTATTSELLCHCGNITKHFAAAVKLLQENHN
jgi:hypothetical protein